MIRNLTTTKAHLSNEPDNIRVVRGLARINILAKKLSKATSQYAIADLVGLDQSTVNHHVKAVKEEMKRG